MVVSYGLIRIFFVPIYAVPFYPSDPWRIISKRTAIGIKRKKFFLIGNFLLFCDYDESRRFGI